MQVDNQRTKEINVESFSGFQLPTRFTGACKGGNSIHWLVAIGYPSGTASDNLPHARTFNIHLLLLRRKVEESGTGSVTVEAGYEKRPSSGPLYDGNQTAARRAATTILI